MELGSLVVRFRELREDERVKGAVREVVEWLLLFVVLVMIFCI
jgi:uncharacterized membrane protein SpoIIM required for sporulation